MGFRETNQHYRLPPPPSLPHPLASPTFILANKVMEKITKVEIPPYVVGGPCVASYFYMLFARYYVPETRINNDNLHHHY